MGKRRVNQPEDRTESTWKCAVYVRLSREDIDSNSMESQKAMLIRRIESDPDMELAGIWEDDGYSGIHYNRPGFQSLMRAVEAHSINCILVKDLSRLGRDYIETGRLLQLVFPSQNIRFLAINDQYDSLHSQGSERDLVLPIRNFVNDSYCRDISIKVRSHQDVKRRNGEYIGAFPVYGYQKCPHNNNCLEPDPNTSSVVSWIYQARLNGRSALRIANDLNQQAIPSPMAYKKLQGIPYTTSFTTSEVPKWSAQAILRILNNRIYTGTLQQGKSTKINYKIDQRKYHPESEWIAIKNAHTPLISSITYEVAQDIIHRNGTCKPSFQTQKTANWLTKLTAYLLKQVQLTQAVPVNPLPLPPPPSQTANSPSTKHPAPSNPSISPVFGPNNHTIPVPNKPRNNSNNSSSLQSQPKIPPQPLEPDAYLAYLIIEETRWKQLLLLCYQDYKNEVIQLCDYQILRDGYTQKLTQIQTAIHQKSVTTAHPTEKPKHRNKEQYEEPGETEHKESHEEIYPHNKNTPLEESDKQSNITQDKITQNQIIQDQQHILQDHIQTTLLRAHLFSNIIEESPTHYTVKCRFPSPSKNI